MLFLVLVLALIVPSVSFAAYQNPRVISNDRQQNGFPKITFEFTGNAGEPIVRRSYVVNPSTTATVLRNWIDDVINELDLMHAAGTLAILQPGQTIPRLARVNPAPTACQVWTEKFYRYTQAKDSGVTAIATDLATLKANLESTYPAGCIQ